MTPDLFTFLADAVYALLLGTAIGIEREWRQHAGTMRTCACKRRSKIRPLN